MIKHSKVWLDNLLFHNHFKANNAAGCLTDEEYEKLKVKYPIGFYHPGIFVRIGLFILTCIIIAFSTGLLSLMLADARLIDNFGWPLVLGVGCYVILELMMKKKHYYQSGIDNALLWSSAISLTMAFAWMLDTLGNYKGDHYIGLSLFVLLLSIYLTLRFTDLLMSVVTCISYLASIFFLWNSIGAFGLTTMPFTMMLASGSLYFVSVKLYAQPKATYYQTCLAIAQIVSLMAIYLSGNYFVVQRLSAELNGAAPGTPITFGLIFWIWTIIIPLIYIIWGVKKKDKVLLRTGMLLVASAIFTFRNYYHVLPVEVALTLGGCILLALSYLLIKYLKTPKHGFTYAEPNGKSLMDRINIESLIIGETFSHTSNAPTQSNSTFGGGSSGGGGSSANY